MSDKDFVELVLRGLYMIVEALEMKLDKTPRISQLRQAWKAERLSVRPGAPKRG